MSFEDPYRRIFTDSQLDTIKNREGEILVRDTPSPELDLVDAAAAGDLNDVQSKQDADQTDDEDSDADDEVVVTSVYGHSATRENLVFPLQERLDELGSGNTAIREKSHDLSQGNSNGTNTIIYCRNEQDMTICGSPSSSPFRDVEGSFTTKANTNETVIRNTESQRGTNAAADYRYPARAVETDSEPHSSLPVPGSIPSSCSSTGDIVPVTAEAVPDNRFEPQNMHVAILNPTGDLVSERDGVKLERLSVCSPPAPKINRQRFSQNGIIPAPIVIHGVAPSGGEAVGDKSMNILQSVGLSGSFMVPSIAAAVAEKKSPRPRGRPRKYPIRFTPTPGVPSVQKSASVIPPVDKDAGIPTSIRNFQNCINKRSDETNTHLSILSAAVLFMLDVKPNRFMDFDPFKLPVAQEVEAFNYTALIKEPRCLNDIVKFILDNHISNPDELWNQLMLIPLNAAVFNKFYEAITAYGWDMLHGITCLLKSLDKSHSAPKEPRYRQLSELRSWFETFQHKLKGTDDKSRESGSDEPFLLLESKGTPRRRKSVSFCDTLETSHASSSHSQHQAASASGLRTHNTTPKSSRPFKRRKTISNIDSSMQ